MEDHPVSEVHAMATSSRRLATEQFFSALSHLSLPELEQVFKLVLALQATCKATHVSATESALLVRINQGLPAALRERMAALVELAKCRGVSLAVLLDQLDIHTLPPH